MIKQVNRTPTRLKKSKDKGLRLHGTIARDLGLAIVSGRYKPGDILVGEIESSEKLAVSRTAYREAVRILAAKGLVESRPKVGTKITSRERWHLLDPDVLSWAFEADPDLDLLESLFELRDIVEAAAAALAATRRTTEHLDQMRQAVEQMAHFTLATPEGRQADMDFHSALLAATGNPYIISLTTGVNAAVDTTNMFKQRERPLPRDPVPDHLRVFQAIADRDAARAHSEMSALVRLALQDTPVPQRNKAKTKSTKGGR
jgi:DNA-binding FadR family transcriptional regulator